MDRHRIDDFVGGWFIGDFEPALLRTDAFEAAFKLHRRDEPIAPHIHHETTEYNVVTVGEMRINGADLGAGDVFVLHPGERVDARVLTAEAHVFCIKVPSNPGDKELCEP